MPYIKQEDRDRLDKIIKEASLTTIGTAGNFNYLITKLCLNFIEEDSEISEANYGNLNEVIGVLECAKLEMYRRIVASYENKKIEENGDVY